MRFTPYALATVFLLLVAGVAHAAPKDKKPARRMDLLYFDARLLTCRDQTPPAARPVLEALGKQETFKPGAGGGGRPRVAVASAAQVAELLTAFRSTPQARIASGPSTLLVTDRRVDCSARVAATFPAAGRTLSCQTGFDCAATARGLDGSGAVPVRIAVAGSEFLGSRADPANAAVTQVLTAAWTGDVTVVMPLETTVVLDLGEPTFAPDGFVPEVRPGRALLLARVSATDTAPLAEADDATRQATARLYRAWTSVGPKVAELERVMQAQKFADARGAAQRLAEHYRPAIDAAIGTEYEPNTHQICEHLSSVETAVQHYQFREAREQLAAFKKIAKKMEPVLARRLSEWGMLPRAADK